MEPFRIGLVGLGTVGQGLVRLLSRSKPMLEGRSGARWELSWVCDRHVGPKWRRLGAVGMRPRLEKDFRRALRDPAVDVVVELIGGVAPARGLILQALASGKHVVTANKQLLSHSWPQLVHRAQVARRFLGLEAAVAGGIPIVLSLRQGLSASRVRSLLGILNGTANFVLTQMAHRKISQREALKEAQRRGLAERRSWMDTEGVDSAHKLSVLASLVAGGWVRCNRIPCEGIGGVSVEDVIFAQEKLGRAVRLLAGFRFLGGFRGEGVRVLPWVHPRLVPLGHPLAAVHGEYNGVFVETDAAGDLFFYGKGAGAYPAASAVLGDLVWICQQRRVCLHGGAGFTQSSHPVRLESLDGEVFRYFLRLQVGDRPGVLSKVCGVLGRAGVSIAEIFQEATSQGACAIRLVTHSAREERFQKAFHGLRLLRGVRRDPLSIRLLD
ncbi:MAG: homoserine dehydrogenase [Elusimicrobia bacterium]|nr:homoserine dehydrogenase [Elusimicrobiota bacterium]